MTIYMGMTWNHDEDRNLDELCGGPPWVNRCRVVAFVFLLIVFPVIYIVLVTQEHGSQWFNISLNETVVAEQTVFNCFSKERWTETKARWCCAHKNLGCHTQPFVMGALNLTAAPRRLGGQGAAAPRLHKHPHDRSSYSRPNGGGIGVSLAQWEIMAKLPTVGMFVHIPKVAPVRLFINAVACTCAHTHLVGGGGGAWRCGAC
jgi:hypothetical protein